MTAKLPRAIKPSQIVAGDLITVEYPAREGITMTHSGRVFEVLEAGNMRIAVTKSGGRLVTWDSKDGFGQGLEITLKQRVPAPQTPLFTM